MSIIKKVYMYNKTLITFTWITPFGALHDFAVQKFVDSTFFSLCWKEVSYITKVAFIWTETQ